MRKCCVIHRRDDGEMLCKVVYREEDMAFSTDPWPAPDTALQYGYIEFGFDSSTMCITGVSGFSPSRSWKRVTLIMPERICTGKLVVMGDPEPGRVYRGSDEEDNWEVYYDKKANWVCLGNRNVKGGLIHVRFLKNAVVTLQRERIQACWINLNEE